MTVLETIVWEYLWGMPLILISLGVGIYLTLFTGFFQFRFFSHAMAVAWKKLFRKGASGASGTISALEALSLAIGATVGVGNIGGVATAIAVGGPGAVFWIWVAGILGQVVKMAEISLAVHYRSHRANGTTFGGTTYYIQKGIGLEKGWPRLAKILSFIFIFGFGVSFVLTMQNYTVSEAISSTFEWNMLAVSIVYTLLLYLMISGGLPVLGRIASRLVPLMCLFYVLAGLFILAKNAAALPSAIAVIFQSAFTGHAAVGGFAGAAFAQVIKIGMSRAVFSNEAGWGSSPMIHASAKTSHPVSQGILGIFEVFVDTMVICSITSLVIIVTNEWSTGASGAALTLNAYENGIGGAGRTVLAIGILLFGLTTSSGIYAQIEVLVRYVLGRSNKAEKTILSAYKWTYPIPGLLLVVVAVVSGMPGTTVWLFADMATALPIFANLLALLLLSPKFFELLGDYKARFMDRGKVDENFRVFYESPERDAVRHKTD
ncbi:MAG: amino acid carrier protein [Desulfobacter sp.]